MVAAHSDQTPILLAYALTELVQKLEDSRLGFGPQELKAVDQTLITIRAVGNHCAPINRIPAEILVHVIKYACTRPRASTEPMPDHATLIDITHVCRRWRAVALGSATLWSHISLHRGSALAFARRSQTSLLTVYVSVRGKKWERKVAILRRRLLPRVQTLHVKVTRIEDLLDLADTLSSPHIASLTLLVNPKMVDGRVHVLHNLLEPPMFGGISTPSLRSLNITVNDLCWHIPFGHFPGLTSLHLIHGRMSHFVPAAFNHLLSLLSNTPNLEVLEVRTVSPFLGSREPPSTAPEPICLARLRLLTIITGQAFTIYSRLSVRENTMVTLVGLPSLLQNRDQHLQPGAFTEVEFLYRGWEVMFRARNAYRYLELGTLVGFYTLPTQPNACAADYAHYMSTVETLSMTVSWHVSAHNRIWSHLLALLAHAPLLKALDIRDVNSRVVPALVRALTQPDPAPCPQLRTLTLSLVSPSGCLIDLKPLLRAMEERARRGVPLESVTICSPRHRTLNPANVLFNLGGVHGLQWLLLCDRHLYHSPDSSADAGYSDFREKAVRSFQHQWVARARENEGNDCDRGDVVDA